MNNKFNTIKITVNNKFTSNIIIVLQAAKLILNSLNAQKSDYLRSIRQSTSDAVTRTNIIIISTLVSYT